VYELHLGIFRWLQPRLGLQVENYPAGIDGVEELPTAHFPAYAKYGAALRALLLAAGFHRARRSDRPGRHGAWIDAVGASLPDLDAEERRLAACALNAFWTPSVWMWLMDTCGLTTEEAIRTASWAIRSLVRALKEDSSRLKKQNNRENGKDRRK
jgi:hypothetical protein